MAQVTPLRAAQQYLILDTGGLLAWAEARPTVRAIVLTAARREIAILVPAVVIAQAIRGGRRDAALNHVLKQAWIVPTTESLARQAGVLLGSTGTTDVVDALVAVQALQHLPSTILTSDPGDLRLLLQQDSASSRVRVILA